MSLCWKIIPAINVCEELSEVINLGQKLYNIH